MVNLLAFAPPDLPDLPDLGDPASAPGCAGVVSTSPARRWPTAPSCVNVGVSVWASLQRAVLRLLAAIALIALQISTTSAVASPFTTADAVAVRTVVQAQLAAFAADDATKAFFYAAPNVRQAMGTPDGFLAMVQRGYPVVYRPASVAFLKANGKNDDVIQRVQMTDADGESWLAIYSLQRQKNKTWRITGCSVVENRGRMA